MILPGPFWELWLQLLLISLGIAVMLGARRLAKVVITAIGLSVAGKVLLIMGPEFAVPLIAIGATYLLLQFLRKTLVALVGKEAAGTVLGTWTVRLVDVIVAWPLRGLAGLLRWIWPRQP